MEKKHSAPYLSQKDTMLPKYSHMPLNSLFECFEKQQSLYKLTVRGSFLLCRQLTWNQDFWPRIG